jgi:hypothetical protein
MESDSYPRLLIASDVPVEKGGGGGLLLYRLFLNYPKEKLFVIQPPFNSNNIRIPGVSYQEVSYKIPKIIRNRLNPFWPILMVNYIKNKIRDLEKILSEKNIEVICTIPHGFLWIAVAEVAFRRKIPLHLIIHDDWPSLITYRREGVIFDMVRRICGSKLGNVYRQAVTRLCVSPGMNEHYRKFYGVEGEILYPTLGEDSPAFVERFNRKKALHNLSIAFCGMIHHDGVMDMLARLSIDLAAVKGELHLFTSLKKENLISNGFSDKSTHVHGFMPANSLGDAVSHFSDALLLPASFLPRERFDIETLFPSKLADYCAIGLPIIFWGPEYSSALRWFEDYAKPGCAVIDNDSKLVIEELNWILKNPVACKEIIIKAKDACEICFSLNQGREILVKNLMLKDI